MGRAHQPHSGQMDSSSECEKFTRHGLSFEVILSPTRSSLALRETPILTNGSGLRMRLGRLFGFCRFGIASNLRLGASET